MCFLRSACRWLFLAFCCWVVPSVAAADCEYRLLVSGYYSNVHIYDACSGAPLRKLDEAGRINGAQAVKIGPDGLLWVVSEEAGKILRYRADTYDFVDTFADVGLGWGATGIAFGGDGDVYVSSYATNVLRRYAIATGARIGADLVAGAILRGPDNGLLTGPDGKLYIPGYDTSNIVRYDPAAGTFGVFVPSQANGIRRTRGLLVSPDGAKLYVSSERSGQILRYVLATGAFDREIARGLGIVTGLAWHPDGSLLAAVGDAATGRVVKLDPETGTERAVLVQPLSGGLSGPTYVAVIPAPAAVATPDPATIGSQYWITGLATLAANTLDIPDAYTTLGTGFGPAFDPAQVRRLPWGRIKLTFTSCTEAMFEWQSSAAGSAGFGSGSYRVQRILRNQATTACEAAGFANAPNKLWIGGAWYGGEARSGEGLMLDVTAEGMVFVAWFTHRPAGM
jgi:DNA-binding beta-propeller fold protein YncE